MVSSSATRIEALLDVGAVRRVVVGWFPFISGLQDESQCNLWSMRKCAMTLVGGRVVPYPVSGLTHAKALHGRPSYRSKNRASSATRGSDRSRFRSASARGTFDDPNTLR